MFTVLIWALFMVGTIFWLNVREPEQVFIRVPSEPEVITLIREVEIPTKSENTPHYSELAIDISNEDKDLLARIAYHEARGEGLLGQRAVVEVVLNRVLSDRFPSTIPAVLTQPGQFCSLDELRSMRIQEPEAFKQCMNAVEATLKETEPLLDSDVVYFMTSKSYGSHVEYTRIGGHSFYYI